MEFEFKIYDQYFIIDIPEKDIIRECNLIIKMYSRPDKPGKQQIYINHQYFITIPDTEEFYNKNYIFFIQELYKNGYELKEIKQHLKGLFINVNNEINKVYF